MWYRLFDKLLFGVLLLLALQVPQLADHYRQYIAGYYQSLNDQIQGLRQTANRHGYIDLDAMIDDHLNNATPSVRSDAQHKRRLLEQQRELKASVQLFAHGGLVEQAVYMFNPTRFERLRQTLRNFTPGIPLHRDGLLFGVVVGLLLNLLLNCPWLALRWWRRRQTKPRSTGPG